MTRVFVVRHGYTDWNKIRRYQGFADVELNAQGIREGESLAERLKNEHFDAIYSSPLKRAKKTAELVNKYHNLEIHEEMDLREINFGDWEGLTFDEICQKYPELSKEYIKDPAHFTTPNGESFEDLQKRSVRRINEIVEENRDKTILVITHGGLISTLICSVLDLELNNLWKFKSANTGITVLEYHSDPVISTFNEIAHLNNLK